MNRGKVVLIGAGPGDFELLTIKAVRYLSVADTVLCDRLVNPTIIERFCKAGCQVIYVGKEGYSDGSTAQLHINQLLVEHYREGEIMVRLKGGDVAFYANVLDELNTLIAHGLPFEIVPGITAASGASAYAGIPLTARGYADSVRFITLSNKDTPTTSFWKEIALTKDTLVLYMTSAKLSNLISNLQEHGISEDNQIAIIEQATTSAQKVQVFSITDPVLKKIAPISPSLIIIGKVVGLHQKFKWIENNTESRSFFKNSL